jgi:serine/threonine-protein kinase
VIPAVLLTVAAGATGYLLHRPSTTSKPVTPVAATALDGLLLSPDQINAAVGSGGMTVKGSETAMEDASAQVSDKVCLPLDGPFQVTVYAGSGWTAGRSQGVGDGRTHFAIQTVVLFPSAHDAGAFFTVSAQRWPACANREYTVAQEAGKPAQVWTGGSVSNTNGTLSATKVRPGNGDSSWIWNWQSCQRALTVANNIVIDVAAYSLNRSDAQSDSAVTIAHQIAAKVPT